MKKHSKVLALLLAMVMTVASSTLVFADAEAVTVTAGSVTLSDTETTEIDINDNSINIAFSDVNAETLADNVSLVTDVKTEKVLHMEGSTKSYTDKIEYILPEELTSGTLKVNYKIKLGAASDRLGLLQICEGTGSVSGLTVPAAQSLEIGFVDGKVWSNNSLSANSSYSGLANQWVAVEMIVNVAAGEDGKNTYSATITKENGDEITVPVYKKTTSSLTHNKVAGLDFYMHESLGTTTDIYMKDFVVTTTVNGVTNNYPMDLSLGDTFPLGSFTERAKGGVTYNVKTTTSSTPVIVESSVNGNTYTLTNDLGWDTSKEYVLQLGTGIKDNSDAAILTEAKNYTFVARDLYNSMKLNSVTDNDGNILEDGDYVSVSTKGINLEFSDEIDRDTVSNITLEKINTVTETALHMEGSTKSYTDKIEYILPEELTSGTMKVSYKIKLGAASDRLGLLQICEGTGSASGLTVPAAQSLEIGFVDGKVWSNNSLSADSKFNGLANQWVTVDMVINVAAGADGKNTYSATITKENGEKITVPVYKKTTSGLTYNKVAGLDFYMHESLGTTTDIYMKDFVVTTTVDGVTNKYPMDLSLGDTFPFGSFTERAKGGVTYKVETNTTTTTEILNWTPAYPNSATVSIIPQYALSYLENYSVTIPTTVLSEEGTALENEEKFNFTAVFHEALYSKTGGFKAGQENLTSISDNFSGDITGWAAVTNFSDNNDVDAVLIVALYKGDKMVDVDVVKVENIVAGATFTPSGTVTIEPEEMGAGYKAAVYIWDSMDSMIPVSLKTCTD